MKIIGLTGPIGAGKDEAAEILKRLGAHIIDADKVAHEMYAFQSPVWQEMIKTFGSKILKRGGEINRKKLGEIVFSDQRKLKELDSIVHPALKEEIIKIADSRKSKVDSKARMVVINAAVLKEIGLADYVDKVWVILASKEKRIKRLLKSGLSKEEALRRINAQVSQKDYLKMADVVVKNEGTLKQLDAKVQACLEL